jgi:hypothetical protein
MMSWEWVGDFDRNGRDVRGKVTAVPLAIGHETESFRLPLWQTMCASGLNETNRERRRRGFCGRLSELLGSSASAYTKAHRPASSNSVPRLALVTSHRPAAIDARIEHRRGPRLEDLRFWQRRVPRPVTNVHDSGV